MPFYTFYDKIKKKEIKSEHLMTISEMEEHMAANPHLDIIPGCPGFGDSWKLGLVKPSNEFRDKLKDIKRRNPKSTMHIP